jgi:hypothetical protein
MAGMRDKLIHDYFGVDYELVWDVASAKIPEVLTRSKRSWNVKLPEPRSPHTAAISAYRQDISRRIVAGKRSRFS